MFNMLKTQFPSVSSKCCQRDKSCRNMCTPVRELPLLRSFQVWYIRASTWFRAYATFFGRTQVWHMRPQHLSAAQQPLVCVILSPCVVCGDLAGGARLRFYSQSHVGNWNNECVLAVWDLQERTAAALQLSHLTRPINWTAAFMVVWTTALKSFHQQSPELLLNRCVVTILRSL